MCLDGAPSSASRSSSDEVWKVVRSKPRLSSHTLLSALSKESAIAQVKRDGLSLRFLPEAFRQDREVALAAVAGCGQALEWVSANLRSDPEVVLAAVQHKGWALVYAEQEMRADREVVIAAVQQDGGALWYASDELRADREVVMEAVRQKGWALMYASEELRQDQEVVYTAWCRDNEALTYASEVLRSKMPRFRFLSGEQCHLMDKVCGKSLIVAEVKRQLESELRCRVELMHDGRIFAEQEDRPLVMLGDVDVQVVKLPDCDHDGSSGVSPAAGALRGAA